MVTCWAVQQKQMHGFLYKMFSGYKKSPIASYKTILVNPCNEGLCFSYAVILASKEVVTRQKSVTLMAAFLDGIFFIVPRLFYKIGSIFK